MTRGKRIDLGKRKTGKRKFGKNHYISDGRVIQDKRLAQSIAHRKRAEGNLARVVKIKKGYRVFSHTKK